jgi:hypothetical protein
MVDLVGRSNILRAKFTKNPALKVHKGFELGKDYALIVYCYDRKSESVKRKLTEELGVDKMFWEYEKGTFEENRGVKVYENGH